MLYQNERGIASLILWDSLAASDVTGQPFVRDALIQIPEVRGSLNHFPLYISISFQTGILDSE